MSPAELLPAIGKTALTLFIIIDSFGTVPIVSTLLQDFSPEERRSAVDTSVLVSFVILLASALVGSEILELFGVGTGELLIASSLLLTVIALDMMFGFLPPTTHDPQIACVVPVATPLLAGPGAISTVLLTVQSKPFPSGYIIAIAGTIIALAASWLILRRVEDLIRLLGERGSLIIAKLMGILVMVIAVGFAVRGVTEVVARISGS